VAQEPAGLEPLLAAAGQGVLVLGEDGRIAHSNARITELFGYRADELRGREVELLVPLRLGARHAAHRAGYAAAPHGGPMAPAIDCRGRRKDGTEFPVAVDLGCARIGDGWRVLALVRDVTAHRRAERRLQAEFAVTRVMAEAASLPEATPRLLGALGECLGLEVGELWLVDLAAGVMRQEGAWAVPGIDIGALDVAARHARFVAGDGLAGRVWATGRPEWVSDVQADPRFQRRAAATAIGLRAACAFPVVQGAVTIGAMLYFTRAAGPPDAEMLELVADIGSRVGQYIAHRRAQHDLQRQRQALARQEKLAGLGRLVAGVVHELNNPLGIVSSRAELLLHDAVGSGLPADVVEDLRVVHRNVQRATAITQALLAFARQAPRELQPVDVNDVVEDALAAVAGVLAADHVRIETALDPLLPTILGDPHGLGQALLALLKNAREAMPGGGGVRVATAPEPGRPGWIRLSITDTGAGITDETLAHVFEPFHTTKPRAAGLGLAIVYGIVRDHGGHVEVESAPAPASGTTVVITLPAGGPGGGVR
jgi:PAS domain S-box-containing protein